MLNQFEFFTFFLWLLKLIFFFFFKFDFGIIYFSGSDYEAEDRILNYEPDIPSDTSSFSSLPTYLSPTAFCSLPTYSEMLGRKKQFSVSNDGLNRKV